MLTGRMPPETFPPRSECQSSIDYYFTEQKKYKIFPNLLLIEQNSSKPSAATTRFEKAKELTQPINAGIIINDPACKLILGSVLKTTNYCYATYIGRIPLSFYAEPTPAGDRFKLEINANDLDIRTFAKEDDLSFNTISRDKNTFYSDGGIR